MDRDKRSSRSFPRRSSIRHRNWANGSLQFRFSVYLFRRVAKIGVESARKNVGFAVTADRKLPPPVRRYDPRRPRAVRRREVSSFRSLAFGNDDLHLDPAAIDALFDGRAKIVGDFSLQDFALAAEPTTNRVRVPRSAELVAAERSVRMLQHQALSDGPRCGRKIDHPRSASLTACLVLRRGKHPQPLFDVDVPCFDEPDLLRPGARFLNQPEIVVEALVLDRFEDRRALVGTENRFTPLGGGLRSADKGEKSR